MNPRAILPRLLLPLVFGGGIAGAYRNRGRRGPLFACIEPFYNRSRRHSTLGYKSPTQFMHDWIAAQQERKKAA